MASPHIFVEQSELIAVLMPELYESAGVAEWWCISKPLAEALEKVGGQIVINDGLGCWWARPYQGSLLSPEAAIHRLGLTSFLA